MAAASTAAPFPAAKAGEVFAALKVNLTAETGVKPAPLERRARNGLPLAIKPA
jgi:hypothetical protein